MKKFIALMMTALAMILLGLILFIVLKLGVTGFLWCIDQCRFA